MDEMRRKNILLVGHDASRTGAPLWLLDLMRRLVREHGRRCDILLRDGGELAPEYAQWGHVYEFCPPRWCPRGHALSDIARRVGMRLHRRRLLAEIAAATYDLVFSNTVVNANVLEFLRPLGIPVVVQIQELPMTIAHYGGHALMDRTKTLADAFIADSNACKKALVEMYDLPENLVTVVHLMRDVDAVVERGAGSEHARKDLGIERDAFLVVGSGALRWRKGFNFFLQLALSLRNRRGVTDARFVWFGTASEEALLHAHHDLDRMGLADVVFLPGLVENPLPVFAAADAFAFVTREDAFGLAGMEAAMLGTPVFCFEGSEGPPELFDHRPELVVPYGDADAMAERMLAIRDDPDLRGRLVRECAETARRVCDPEARMAETIAVIEGLP